MVSSSAVGVLNLAAALCGLQQAHFLDLKVVRLSRMCVKIFHEAFLVLLSLSNYNNLSSHQTCKYLQYVKTCGV